MFTLQPTKMLSIVAFLACFALLDAKPYYRSTSGKLRIFPRDPLLTSGSESLLTYTYEKEAPEIQPIVAIENDNYNVIMPDYYDHHPAESMQYQNFEQFSDSEMAGTNADDLGMDESQFLTHQTPVRAPQALTEEERLIRAQVEPVDLKREKKAALKLKKGSSVPRGESAYEWDQFDYDSYSVNPGDNSKYISG